MEIKVLNERIQKAQEKILKIEKRIQKWESKKTLEAFIKEQAEWYSQNPKSVKTLDDLYQARYNYFNGQETMEKVKSFIDSSFVNNLDTCDREIKYANRDLEETKLLINKYKNMVSMEEAKKEKLNETKIEAIWNFLLNYKELVKNWIRQDAKKLKEYYRLNSELCDKYNSGYYREHREEYKEDNKKEKMLYSSINSITKNLYSRNSETLVDEVELEKFTQKDIEERYLTLINQVTELVGEITDAKYLRIGAKGEINGYIDGTKGRAKVETISAGGYNIQCFHYRTLINKVGK